MIDIHTHLLPGVDDGSRTIATSVSVLEQFRAGGVETVVCTPHLKASKAASAPFMRHAEILSELVAAAPPTPKLILGWEIMLDLVGADLTDVRLTFGTARAMLVEFSRVSLPAHAGTELRRIRATGVVPVVAHPERYWGCTADIVAEWRRGGAVIQMDVAAVLRQRRRMPLAERLLEEGQVDIFASDTHGDARSLVPARAWLREVGTEEQADLLTRENARRLLAGEPLVQVPPLVRQRGMLERLRELFMGADTTSRRGSRR